MILSPAVEWLERNYDHGELEDPDNYSVFSRPIFQFMDDITRVIENPEIIWDAARWPVDYDNDIDFPFYDTDGKRLTL